VEAAAATLDRARQAVEIYAGIRPLTARSLELAGKAYAAGQGSLGDLLAAKDRAFTARREEVDARAAFGEAVAELARAAGWTAGAGR